MSKEKNRGMIDAYQKMLNDGSAFKEVDLTMRENPSISEAESGLGERTSGRSSGRSEEPNDIVEEDIGYEQFDSEMERRISSLRNKMGKGKGNPSTTGNREISSLKKRVAKLEEALMLMMETHEKLLG